MRDPLGNDQITLNRNMHMQAAPRQRIRSEQNSELAGDQEIQRLDLRNWIHRKMAAFIKLEDSPMFQKQVIDIYIFSDFGFLLSFNLSIVWIWKWNHCNILTENTLIIIAAPFYRILGCYTCAVKEYIFSSQSHNELYFLATAKFHLNHSYVYIHLYIYIFFFFMCLRLRIF